ncbi:MAG: undecaprenyl-diphosphate phosphatase [Patescibacteria group bacterium]|nr:undecaprenyl-diphosphate phosphatase [Patescibacteria group bacterium]
MIEAIILGIIEGITEFLPVSSTAHLILASYLLKIEQTNFHKFFEVFIQSGAICAVIFNYFYLLKQNKDLIKKIIVSFMPTAFFGFFLYKIIKNVFFENYILIALSFIILGIIFIIIEKLINNKKIELELNLNNLNYKKAFLIGIFQSLAVIPGVSRAGAVILGMLILKFKREESVLYSFFIAVPTIISAGLYDLYKTGFNELILSQQNIIYLIIGFITSFIFALITIKWFIKYLQKNNLKPFGWYRIILGIIFLLIFNF